MTETAVPARKGPYSVTHVFPNTYLDERRPVALRGIPCRVVRGKLYRKHLVFSAVIIFLVSTEGVYRNFSSKLRTKKEKYKVQQPTTCTRVF